MGDFLASWWQDVQELMGKLEASFPEVLTVEGDKVRSFFWESRTHHGRLMELLRQPQRSTQAELVVESIYTTAYLLLAVQNRLQSISPPASASPAPEPSNASPPPQRERLADLTLLYWRQHSEASTLGHLQEVLRRQDASVLISLSNNSSIDPGSFYDEVARAMDADVEHFGLSWSLPT